MAEEGDQKEPDRKENSLADELTRLQIEKTRVETQQLQDPWYKKHPYWVPIATVALTLGGWYFNAERLKLQQESSHNEAYHTTVSEITNLGGSVVVFPDESILASVVIFDGEASEISNVAADLAFDEKGPRQIGRREDIDDLLWRLTDVPNVIGLSIDAWNYDVSEKGIRGLRKLPSLGFLRIDGRGLGDDELAAICELTSLESLQVNGSGFTDAGVSKIAKLRSLENLFIDGPGITDSGASTLTSLRKLRRLSIDGTGLTPASLEHVSNCPRLEEFTSSIPVGDAEVADFAKLPLLTTLILHSADEVTDDGLAKLSEARGLRHLILSGVDKITDDGVVHLQKIPSLVTVYLAGAEVTDKSLMLLSGLPKLQDLQLTSSKITDDGVVHLLNLRGLHKLRLDNADISNDSVAQLVGLEGLQVLMFHNTRADGGCIDSLIRMRSLHEVHLNSPNLANESIRRLESVRPDLFIAHYPVRKRVESR